MVSVAVLGNGVVGSGVCELINKNDNNIKLSKVLVKNIDKHRSDKNYSIITDKIEDIFSKDIDIVVELIGGIHPAYEYIKTALKNKKHVITANKDLISKYGEELLELAYTNSVKLYFEASVGGGIPIIKNIKNYLISNEIKSIKGILNGTTNFILTKMNKEKTSYENALKSAQELGFAEFDPSSDINGYDSARKLSILSTIAYKKKVCWENFKVEGIQDITESDIKKANELGGVIKLLGISNFEDGKVYASVRPVIVNKDSEFAKINDEYNSIIVEGDSVGKLTFNGKGAGKLPTATAVYSDIIDSIQNKENSFLFNYEKASLESNSNTKCDWYIKINYKKSHIILNELTEHFKNLDLEINKKTNQILVMAKSECEKYINEISDRLLQLEDVDSINSLMVLNN
ncbi:homoserine dehydrogenase [Tepidibacter mesophilus]|uniref:homoserine dehydrogenase n=1 Tax=Tepidibacter mesophilus TaxID=655607 RepID=UPI000C082F67|nr:homoserine dehydrogenase [Tepidibacter mesophilus]